KSPSYDLKSKLSGHSIHLVLPDNNDFLTKREILGQLPLAINDREVLVASKLQIDLGLFQFRFELGVDPDVALLNEILVRDELILCAVANEDPVLVFFVCSVED